MNELFNNQDVSSALISAIGNTILHSLWQGVLLAILGGAILVFGRNLRPSVRYLLFLGALSLFLMSVIATFAGTFSVDTDMASREVTVNSSDGTLSGSPDRWTLSDLSEQIAYIFGSLSDYHGVIVLLWFIVVCIKGIRMSVSIYSIYRMKSYGLVPTELRWQRLVDRISDGLGIKQRVVIFESRLAKTPLIIGHLKPLVLFPISLVNSLSVEQVEAVLAHELAHVCRRDFLVNLLQSTVEVLFFFNPAVLWISSLIRAERENCCDDIAVAYTGSKSLYVNALVNCEEYNMTTPHLAMGLKGDRQLLINRVRRLLKRERPTLNLVERLVLATCLCCTMLVGVAFAINPITTYTQSRYPDIEWTQEEPRVQSDKIIEELVKRKLIPNIKNFRLRITNDALYVNGKRQSDEVHRRIMQRYVKNPNDRLNFTQTVKTD
ncbi:M56 family metallopeptidase [Olivibacter sp. SDN3]|uniref:M56 family metallopeptidase n=1 Tax=Olivibacter sp. SDN3 TaxID=2764720 RepID=UPI0016519A74|nr:M56 family metallopeptidase [Olivibacter sp. SDN3]QNL48066.1 M56 family metallopeptidase [Olivibacter sp. SDN3]